MDFKGTKGKWNLVDYNKVASDSLNTYICEMWGMKTEKGEANARLISQAPDLLQSFQKLVEMIKSPYVLNEEGFLKELDEAIREAEEVIRKALGVRLFYRVANINTQQGLWYDLEGEFTGLIHDKYSFCSNNALQMPFDSEIVGWLSATETLDELLNWFTKDDLVKLEEHGYSVLIYEASDYKIYNNHWVIKQDSSKLTKRVPGNLIDEYQNELKSK